MAALRKYGTRPRQPDLSTGVRKVSRTYGTAQHLVAASKSHSQLPFVVDGQAEVLVTQILQLDPEVRSFKPQPMTVDLVESRLLFTAEERDAAIAAYHDRAGHSLYTPDFETDDSIGSGRHVIEVKLEGYQGSQDYQNKLQHARAILKSCNYCLVELVVPSEQTRPPWTTVSLLHQASSRKDLWPSPAMLESIQQLADGGASTGKDFVQGLGISANLLPVLIASGALAADPLAGPICGATLMQPAHGDLSHLQLLRRLIA